jgi:predicted nucleic acid-binding protein
MEFLADTNIISELYRPRPNRDVRAWVNSQPLIGISVITVEELTYGFDYKNATIQLAWFQKFLDSRCQLLTVTPQIAEQCGIMRSRFRQQGITRSQSDMLIAATAAHHNLTVATRNIKDFRGCGLRLFDPFQNEYV